MIRLIPDLVSDFARARGIFALPTKHGTRGMVLLNSLRADDGPTGSFINFDLGSREIYRDLLGMHHRGDIELVSVPIAETRASLQSRGLLLDIYQRDVGHAGARTGIDAGPETTFHAVMIEAVAATANTITNHQIEWLWHSRAISPATVIDRATLDDARSPELPLPFGSAKLEHHHQCRMLCAAERNRRAGIVEVPQIGKDRPYMLLRPSGERFVLFENDCREEALVEACEVIAGHVRCETTATWIGNRLTIHCDDGAWTLVELDW